MIGKETFCCKPFCEGSNILCIREPNHSGQCSFDSTISPGCNNPKQSTERQQRDDELLRKTEAVPEKCLTPGCDKKAKWKGICQRCYSVALNLIEKQETTWEELFDLGMCLLDEKPFYTEFRRRKKAAVAKETGPECTCEFAVSGEHRNDCRFHGDL